MLAAQERAAVEEAVARERGPAQQAGEESELRCAYQVVQARHELWKQAEERRDVQHRLEIRLNGLKTDVETLRKRVQRWVVACCELITMPHSLTVSPS